MFDCDVVCFQFFLCTVRVVQITEKLLFFWRWSFRITEEAGSRYVSTRYSEMEVTVMSRTLSVEAGRYLVVIV